MGSRRRTLDHERRTRANRKRRVRPRILIVCGGKKTEPGYFRYVDERLRANIDIRIEGDGWSPKSLVERAIQAQDADRRAAKRSDDPEDVFEAVYAVTDVDDSTSPRRHRSRSDTWEQVSRSGARTTHS